MKFRNILILFVFILLTACENYGVDKSKELILKPVKKYKNSGFALIYSDALKVKNLDNRSLKIFPRNLSS